MEAPATTPREIAVPVSVFRTLRSELGKEAGHLPTIHALHHAGYEAGTAAAATFSAGLKGDAVEMTQSAFWRRLVDFFSRRGWGTLSPGVDHAGIGVLASHDWAEATADHLDADGSCCFSAGFISGLLSEVAGGPVAVLEVNCRTRGDSVCQFAFGSERAIHELYGRLVDGADLDAALAAL